MKTIISRLLQTIGIFSILFGTLGLFFTFSGETATTRAIITATFFIIIGLISFIFGKRNLNNTATDNKLLNDIDQIIRKQRWIAPVIFIVPVTLLTAYLIIFEDPPPPSETELAVKANSRCLSEVKRRLKSPKTASFPFTAESILQSEDKNTFLVKSYVDSQNSFGAMLRTHWTCQVLKEGEKWRVQSVQFEQQ